MTAQFGEEEPFSLNGLSTDSRRKAACGRTEYHSKLSSSKHPPEFCLLGYSGLCISTWVSKKKSFRLDVSTLVKALFEHVANTATSFHRAAVGGICEYRGGAVYLLLADIQMRRRR